MFDEIRESAATLTEKVFNRGNYEVSTTTSPQASITTNGRTFYGDPARATN